MFEKLVAIMFPIVVVLLIIQFIVFFGAWILIGRKDPKYQGKVGLIKYYFHTWREAFRAAKETYEQEEVKNTD